MAMFKKFFNENILFTKKGEHKYKLVINLEKKDDFVIIHYIDGKIKQKININENSLDNYEFLQKTKNLFWKKYIKLKPKTINEMMTADAGIGSTAPDQFSGDFYATGDSRNLFGKGKTDFPITRRPKINDTLMKNTKKKAKKKQPSKNTKKKNTKKNTNEKKS